MRALATSHGGVLCVPYNRCAARAAAAQQPPVPHEPPAKQRRRPAPIELRRGELSLAWSTPPWFLEKQAPLRALDVSSDVAGDDPPDDAVVTASLQVDPVGGGYYVRGRCEVAPPPRRACACCGALHDAPLEGDFQVWLTDSPAERRSGSRRSARRGPASDAAAGPGADDEVLLFGRNASGVDLSGVVRDALLLAAPPASRCAAPECAAPGAPAPPAPPPGGSNAFGALAALRERLSANPPPKA